MNQTSTTNLALTFTGTATYNGQTSTLPTTYTKSITMTAGSAANQATTIYSTINATITASSSTTYDLAGSLTDYTGATITFTKIKEILLYAYPANTNTVNIGGAGANAFIGCFGSTTDVVKVNPGGWFHVMGPDLAGYTVTAGTGDLLKVANGGAGTSVSYDLIIIGV